MGNNLKIWLNSLDENIYELDLSNKNLNVFPDLSRFTQLKKINCRNNCFVSLPDNIGTITSLIELNISHNNLTYLPDNLPVNLTSLDCSGNKLTSLPNNFPEKLEFFSFDKSLLDVYPLLNNSENRVKHIRDINLTLTSLNS
jgi:Leucine-rich repeat (LRR) protein